MHSEVEQIEEKYSDSAINIALDTIKKGKQAIFFVNTKPSAEKLAEEISAKIKSIQLNHISEKIEKALPKPTRQCKRLARCIMNGTAFHHAGLAMKQRDLIEENFKNKSIKIICATPTLAIGVDLPAFRAVIRDLKRYGGRWGMQNIPVLEYHQMAGRAGRPSFDKWGEAITIAKTEAEKENIYYEYIKAESEDIFSKLAVEPVLRTYLLSLISSGFVKTRKQIVDFFEKTFWAYQYKDMNKLEFIIDKMLSLLEEWEFILPKNTEAKQDFVSADEIQYNSDDESYSATRTGKRAAELYLDPYTANMLIKAMNKASERKITIFSILQMICSTLEIRPLLSVRVKDYQIIENTIAKCQENILSDEPEPYDLDYNDFLSSIKTAMFMEEWCEEIDEETLLERFNIRPGEIRAKLEIGDWLIYSCIELAKILSLKEFQKDLAKARIRLKYGVKEELLPLMRLKGIGRIRARKMYNAGLKDIKDIKDIDFASLSQLIGKANAESIKDQLGQQVPAPVSDKKRKGQMSLGKYE
ncbi:MAG: helicase-related protein [Candidatus Woesearchaeota archaeon]